MIVAKAWIRVDANSTIGRGHLSRCLALADMIKEEWSVCFMVAATNRAYCEALLQDWEVVYLAEDASLAPWLGKSDLLIVDSYAVDNAWRKTQQAFVKCLVDINDIPGEIKGADVILNHCPGVTPEQYLADPGTVFLLGMEYAILRAEFLEYARSARVEVHGKGVFICYGGADPYQLGHRVALELLTAGFTDPVHLVSAAESEHSDQLTKYANFHLHSNLSAAEMRTYMSSARLLLLSSSILSFEAIALRKPLMCLYYVDNQALIYEGLVAEGLAYGYGRVNEAEEVSGIHQKMMDLYESEQQLAAMLANAVWFLDGRSDERIGRELLGIASRP